jgi:hypothetical protein
MTKLRCIIWCAVSSQAQNEPEKISLPQQESDSCTVAKTNGWQIIDVLKVPGHSRRYIDFHRLASDAATKGIDAFNRLYQHWESQDFDIMIVRDGDRFARTQALHAYVVERTIKVKARIYSLQDGWIDERNYRMWIAMGGYKAAGDIDRLVKARDKAITALAQRGLPISSRIPISHKVIRDPKTGKAVCLQIDEDRRRLWNDLAELVLEGVAWHNMEVALFKRFGHTNDKGNAYYPNYFYRLIMKPLFWGHMARHHNSATSKNGYRYGRWIWDENEAPPKGATIFRNTHEAVWTGDLGKRIQQELDRRSCHIKGRARPAYTHRLSGVAICAECGQFMSTHVTGNYRGLYCPASKGRPTLPKCNHKRVVSERKIIARIDEFLKQMLEQQSSDIFKPRTASKLPDVKEKRALIEVEIDQIEDQIRLLIRKQLAANEEIQYI